jgi:Phosphotransferase enzyme family
VDDLDEQVLSSGGITHVVRIGDTVRRPVRPFTASIQSFLAHLHTRGFTDAPVPLGYDDEGREVLSYVDGEVPEPPLPDYAASEQTLVDIAGLVRRLHDAAADFEAPPGAIWGSVPGTPTGIVSLFDRPELISHQDYCPGNVVFRNGRPVAFIDFDLSRPTTRVVDAVNAIYWWTPLTSPEDRQPLLADANIAGRVRLFADTYGMSKEQRALVVPTALQRARNVLPATQAAAEVDPVFRRWWLDGQRERLERALTWLTAEARAIEAALLSD